MTESWSIRKRISLGFATILTLLGGIAAVSVAANIEISTVFGGYRSTTEQTVAVNGYVEKLFEGRIAALRYRFETSEENATAVDDLIAHMLEGKDAGTEIFADDPDKLAAIQQLIEDTERFDAAFKQMVALQGKADEVIRDMDALPDAFEKALNGMLFTARISGDQKTQLHVSQAQLAFIKGLGNVRTYLLTNDASILDVAYPNLNQARSEIDSVASFLRVNGKNTSAAEKALAIIDDYRRFVPDVASLIAERNVIQQQELDILGPAMQAGYGQLLKKVVERQVLLGEEGTGTIHWAEAVVIVGTLIVLLLGIALSVMIGRWIAMSVGRMANSMTKLAGGDLEIGISGAEHAHELGQMARALDAFKQNALRVKEMESQKEADDAETRRERRVMMESLQAAFGQVVDAAVAGDFSRRVEITFEDSELKGLASSVNQLLIAVDGGLSETGRILNNVAEGDLSDRMTGKFAGAFAELQRSVNRTIDQLAQTVAQIQGSANEINGAASEIGSGTEDLARRTEQAASSLEETAASTDGMAATVKQNASSAQTASQQAASANQNAKAGGQVVEQAIAAMSGIEKSAQKITDIISVIDEIAFQTNLLALNASVEAARAGESGKGFAVVAQEVRQLAQRAAQAASDIKALIQDSNGQVQGGVQLVNKAGESLAEIVGSIGKVAQIVQGISDASEGQAAGVQDINRSIAGLDEMTQQNSALVEESSAAARALSDQSRKMAELMAFFKLKEAPGRSEPSASSALSLQQKDDMVTIA